MWRTQSAVKIMLVNQATYTYEACLYVCTAFRFGKSWYVYIDRSKVVMLDMFPCIYQILQPLLQNSNLTRLDTTRGPPPSALHLFTFGPTGAEFSPHPIAALPLLRFERSTLRRLA